VWLPAKLNELYRPFRVGNVQTRANPPLRPETLFGAEGGFDLSGHSWRLKVTLFRNSLNHPIANATLRTQPNLILRQKENVGLPLCRFAFPNRSDHSGGATPPWVGAACV